MGLSLHLGGINIGLPKAVDKVVGKAADKVGDVVGGVFSHGDDKKTDNAAQGNKNQDNNGADNKSSIDNKIDNKTDTKKDDKKNKGPDSPLQGDANAPVSQLVIPTQQPPAPPAPVFSSNVTPQAGNNNLQTQPRPPVSPPAASSSPFRPPVVTLPKPVAPPPAKPPVVTLPRPVAPPPARPPVVTLPKPIAPPPKPPGPPNVKAQPLPPTFPPQLQQLLNQFSAMQVPGNNAFTGTLPQFPPTGQLPSAPFNSLSQFFQAQGQINPNDLGSLAQIEGSLNSQLAGGQFSPFNPQKILSQFPGLLPPGFQFPQ